MRSKLNNFECQRRGIRGGMVDRYIMGNGHMGVPVDRQTDMTENNTFPQLRW